jgi:hypothetical protein
MNVSVSNYVSNLQASFAKYKPEDPVQDGTLRMVLTRIKHARISRGLKDTLNKMVHNLAVDGRIDPKTIKGILDTVFLVEMTEKKPEDKSKSTMREKTVNEQMDEIYTARAEKKQRQEQLDKLGSLFSTKA